jgi:hypothetical protein
VTGLPEATVFAYGRFAREGGEIEQKGRGRGAAKMTVRDAANLLIAVAGTSVTRDAPSAIRDFRNMTAAVHVYRESFEPRFEAWLEPIGVERVRGMTLLKGNFGSFLEFLIAQAGTGGLAQLLRDIPTTEIPKKLWRKWKGNWPAPSVDELVEKGHIKIRPRKDVSLGDHVQLRIVFDRSLPMVDVEIERDWDTVEDLLLIRFGAATIHPSDLISYASDYRIAGMLTQHTLMTLGLTVTDEHVPVGLRRQAEFGKFFDALNWDRVAARRKTENTAKTEGRGAHGGSL